MFLPVFSSADSRSGNFPFQKLQLWNKQVPLSCLFHCLKKQTFPQHRVTGVTSREPWSTLSAAPMRCHELDRRRLGGAQLPRSLWITNKDKHRFIWCLPRYVRSNITQSCRYPCCGIKDSVNQEDENRGSWVNSRGGRGLQSKPNCCCVIPQCFTTALDGWYDFFGSCCDTELSKMSEHKLNAAHKCMRTLLPCVMFLTCDSWGLMVNTHGIYTALL